MSIQVHVQHKKTPREAFRDSDRNSSRWFYGTLWWTKEWMMSRLWKRCTIVRSFPHLRRYLQPFFNRLHKRSLAKNFFPPGSNSEPQTVMYGKRAKCFKISFSCCFSIVIGLLHNNYRDMPHCSQVSNHQVEESLGTFWTAWIDRFVRYLELLSLFLKIVVQQLTAIKHFSVYSILLPSHLCLNVLNVWPTNSTY